MPHPTCTCMRIVLSMQTLSDCATLCIGTWNCHGLSGVKKNLIMNTNFDILCLTETHGWQDSDYLMLNSDQPPKTDKWSGVSLLMSPRTVKYVMGSGSIGSRITYCRFAGNMTNYTVIGVYIPQRKRKNPDQAEIYDQLDNLLDNIPRHDCVIILGDFNSRLSRNEDGYVGQWCIHTQRDSGGDRLLSIMRKFSLRCVSTYFQPPRRHSNATFMNVQPEKPPSQIDYIIVSSRWSTAVRNCSTMWGLPIAVHGRKYDHALLRARFKLRLKANRRKQRRDFATLKDKEVQEAHNRAFEDKLLGTPTPNTGEELLERLNNALLTAQAVIPKKESNPNRKWKVSPETMFLIDMRKRNWEKMSEEERNQAKKEIQRSARDDYRNHIDSVVTEMEQADAVGKTTQVFRLAKVLATKGKTTLFTQPSKDELGRPITSSEKQLELWANYLEKKFSAQPNEPHVQLHSINEEDEPLPSLEEVTACVNQLTKGKATGPDEVPIEQYQASQRACEELKNVIVSIWESEEIPESLVLGDMMMIYKKKSKEDRSNYRALGLLNHSYKTFSMVLLKRILPYIDPKLSDMQAGFRKNRGCRDNILILTMAIHHLLENALNKSETVGVITYIDFVAAFDSINHSYMLTALKEYGVPLKYVRLINSIYSNASIRVRLQQVGGNRQYSSAVPIRRGAIQGDIPSPVVFLVALDKLIKEHGGTETGLPITPTLMLSDLEFADDAALANTTTADASHRLTHLDERKSDTGMTISRSKTKVQHIRHRPRVTPTTEQDILNLPPDKKFQFECGSCGMTYPTNHGLAVHKGRWCKGRRNARKPSRKGTVADKMITRLKVEKHQEQFAKVVMGDEELSNVYSFVYLGAEIAGDGDQQVTLKYRCDIAWGRYNSHRTVLTSTKLPVQMRIRLYAVLVVSSMTHGCEAWLFTENIRKSLNGVNSKMLAQITKRSIHDEAREPSFNVIDHVLKRRRKYLGHILRADERSYVRRFLLELSPDSRPFINGSLLQESGYSNVVEMIQAAKDRNL